MGPSSLRIDLWLWFARLAKSRSRSARLIAAGKVAVNGGAVLKPAHPIRVGDAIVLKLGPYRRSLSVLALAARRGAASAARALYQESRPPQRLFEPQGKWTSILAEEERGEEDGAKEGRRA